MMLEKKLKVVLALGAVIVLGTGFVVGQWASAEDAPKSKFTDRTEAVRNEVPPKPEPSKPASTEKRREVVFRFPAGTYVKEFDAEPFGSGRLTWTYEDDRVSGAIELGSQQFGVSLELAIESEISMSRHGTIYGVINNVRVTQFKVNPEMLGLKNFPVKIGPGLYSFIEPLMNDILVDLPFSYHCRVEGNRMTISNYRILLSGSNLFGKLGWMLTTDSAIQAYSMFQALGASMEGTYQLTDEKQTKPRPGAQKIKLESR